MRAIQNEEILTEALQTMKTESVEVQEKKVLLVEQKLKQQHKVAHRKSK